MKNTVVNLLSNEFTASRAKNPSYSMRAYSNRLGIQVSALSEILNGKRNLTEKMSKRILEGLGKGPSEINQILSNKNELSKSEELSLDHFKVISEWYYFAILSLAEIKGFDSSPRWVSERLNISNREAKTALKKLFKLGMLDRDEEDKTFVTGIQYKTPSDIANAALKTHTLETLELAKRSLINDPVEKRDFSTITMAIDPSQIDEAKKMIKSFRSKISKKLERGNKTEVYKIGIQLFPLSKEI